MQRIICIFTNKTTRVAKYGSRCFVFSLLFSSIDQEHPRQALRRQGGFKGQVVAGGNGRGRNAVSLGNRPKRILRRWIIHGVSRREHSLFTRPHRNATYARSLALSKTANAAQKSQADRNRILVQPPLAKPRAHLKKSFRICRQRIAYREGDRNGNGLLLRGAMHRSVRIQGIAKCLHLRLRRIQNLALGDSISLVFQSQHGVKNAIHP